MHKARAISKKIMGVGVALLLTAQLLPTAAWAQDGGIPINETNFPDQIFREHVEKQMDKDQDHQLSEKEIKSTKGIGVQNMGITNLKGIEYFTEIDRLDCSYNKIGTLDLSGNPKLTLLQCNNCELQTLNLSKNTELTRLFCSNNLLTELNVTQSPQLEELECPGNELTKLDLSENTVLTTLNCGSNQLDDLVLSANPRLVSLSCYNNHLTKLDLSTNTALTTLNCGSNQLAELNISACDKLKELYAEKNALTQLNVSGNPALENLECYENQLTNLNVTQNAELAELECYKNQLKTLDLSGNPKLEILYCDDNGLTDLDLSANKALTQLYFRNNSLYTLNISECGALREVFGGDNHLTSLELAEGVNPLNLNLPRNSYQLDQRENFDCSRLPGKFDINRVISAEGGRFDKANNTFSFEEGQNSAVYTYDAGNGEQVDFRLTAEPHSHTFSTEWTKDATHHWHAATCEHKDKVSDMAQHTFGEWKVQQEPTTEKEGVQVRACDICGFEESKTIPVVTPKPTEQPVEPTAPSESAPETTTPSESTQGTVPSKPATPNTGDSSSMMMWIGVLLGCGVVALVIVLSSKKKK